jgi:hypothetical protein
MRYYTRVLSKQEEFPSLEDLADLLGSEYPDCKLTIEEGDPEEWESLLLSTDDDVEIALIQRNPVSEGSLGEEEIAEFLEEIEDCKPESGVEWLQNYMGEVKTIYAFQHLPGADSEEGSAALHELRSFLWKRGNAIIQADMEGFTNEEGFHILWQFSDSVSGAWNMGVLQDGTWHQFKMDLGDPDHREAFQRGEVPSDLTSVQLSATED